ncbi:alpha/beta fold hydrolase [Sulfuriroseicoccus oceanibius]|uniref:Alpha/beta fold hydrolase n=1 Tax=Sulfuriroseicoccus oceanibius TaxID=2707525 RepID=A0A6B3L8K5_9BACT|nr:alpha/beta fold hydrolase [Sulfuriroseicoccus oceanibius]QQL44683.1 alpha/beta fold hydrolase [Sulfuriroseicoccus oceanibius]
MPRSALVLLLVIPLAQCTTPRPVAEPNGEVVVLLHGLARTSGSMKKMEKALRADGYQTINHDYPSTKNELPELATNSLAPVLERDDVAQAKAIHFVTHSMGGILVRQYLATHPKPPNLGRVVMLAPPNNGSEIVDKLGAQGWFKAIFGPGGCSLNTDHSNPPKQLGPVDYPVGVIAGDRVLNVITTFMVPGPDDGTVSVESSKLDGMHDHRVVHADHTFIMMKRQTIDLTRNFLKTGSFEGMD